MNVNIKSENFNEIYNAKVSMIIPTWDNLHYLVQLIKDIREYSKSNYEIIIVDNGSTDGTAEYCASQKDIKFISCPNSSFSKAINVGIKAANSNYFILMNTDIRINDMGWDLQLIAPFSVSDKIGITSPTTNGTYSPFQRMRNKEDGLPIMIFTDEVAFVCIAIRKELIDRIGYLDESYISGCEDVDYCWRTIDAGYFICVNRALWVEHLQGGGNTTSKKFKNNSNILSGRAKLKEKWGVDRSKENCVRIPIRNTYVSIGYYIRPHMLDNYS